MNFRTKEHTTETASMPIHELTGKPFRLQSLDLKLTPRSRQPLLLALGIEYLSEVNGKHYPVTSQNPYTLIKTIQ